ncbi:kinase-like domain-containing protein [Phyllosticta citrichinensis]|uniref:non-specific serine/threonine protein kinase n=1 Tax=Phyllosticta citrichinensis TaxID=1130410 RepID=A0ABR1XJ78_9PEZI
MSSRSESEGEIHEQQVGKATSSTMPSSRGVSVDRQSRPRASASLSPRGPYENGAQRHRSRSPYKARSPRGEKRRREDDFYSDRERQDPRRFKVRYEDRRPYNQDRRNRVSYADIDRGDTSRPAPRYDDRDHSRYRGHRSRSPPPRPHMRGGQPSSDFRNGRYDSYDKRDRRRHDHEKGAEWRSREFPGTNRPPSRVDYRSAAGRDVPMQDMRPETDRPTEEPANDQAPAQVQPVDEAALIEERRKRREAIKAKYKGQSTPLLVQALHLGNESNPATPKDESSDSRPARSVSPMDSSPITPDGSDPGSPPAVQVQQDEDLANRRRIEDNSTDRDEPSAADYDPTADMNEDRARVEQQQHIREAHQKAEAQENEQQAEPKSQETSKPKPKDEFDMFAEDDDDDMFAEETTSKPIANPSESGKAPQVKKLDSSMLDVWDDHQGYYKVILNELLDDRYEVQARLGKGVFSEVVRARDVQTNTLVAIKIIRNDEVLRKAGVKEIETLEKLADHDPDDKRHCIRMLRWFDHKHHLCMVFEHLSVNLREVLKKFGRDVGLNLKAVRSYAQQMFVALSLLRKCNVVHADIKPDNMLVNDTRNVLKICDLGSAMDISECEVPAGLLVSRFYRAPEIMLGIPHDYGIDTWAIGCTLFELYTGKILFTGRDNNQMLRSIQECRGKMSAKLLKKGWADYVYEHFDENLNLFRSVETDKITNKDVIRMVNFTKPTRDLKSRLIGSSKGLTDAELKEVNLFHDFLDKCLSLNPEKRITPYEALRHPFIHRTKP